MLLLLSLPYCTSVRTIPQYTHHHTISVTISSPTKVRLIRLHVVNSLVVQGNIGYPEMFWGNIDGLYRVKLLAIPLQTCVGPRLKQYVTQKLPFIELLFLLGVLARLVNSKASLEVAPTTLTTLFLLWPWTLTYDIDLRKWPGQHQVEV